MHVILLNPRTLRSAVAFREARWAWLPNRLPVTAVTWL
jgi:hypothetical protein